MWVGTPEPLSDLERVVQEHEDDVHRAKAAAPVGGRGRRDSASPLAGGCLVKKNEKYQNQF